MNAKTFALATLIALTGTTAFAAEGSESPIAASTLSRDAVVAQVAQARATGTQFAGGEGTQFAFPAVSERSRDEVRAEARAARGSVSHLYIGA